MAQKKFTELDPVVGFLGNDDIIAVVQGGVSKQATISQIPVVGSSGTVTSVSIGNLSPLFTASVANSTTTPAISFALVNQNANLVYAGPTNGAAAAPSFRSLVAADIPDLSAAYLPIGGGTLTGALILAADPLVALGAATKQYVDASVVGLWDDRGNFDASGGAYPSSGGSGTAGAILKGDIWTISVAGTLPTGQVVEVGDTVRALVDTPGNTQANWAIAQNNIGYVPLSNTLASANIFVGNGSNVATAVAMSGEATIANTGAVTLSNAAVIGKVLTGYTSGAGTVAATDTILQAIQKLNGNDALAWRLASGGALTADNTISGNFKINFTNSASDAFRISSTFTTTANNQQLVLFDPTITTRATASDVFQVLTIKPTGTAGAASQTWYNLFSDTTNVATTNSPSRWAGYFLGGLRVGNSANASSTNVLLLETTQSQTIFNVTTSGNSIFSINNNSSSTVATITGLAALPANGLGVVGTFTAASGACQMLSLNGTLVAGANNDILRGIRLFPTSFTISTRTNVTTYGLQYQPQATSVSSGSFAAHYGVIVDGATASINIFSGFMVAAPTAFVDCGAVVTAAASLRIREGSTTTAPSSPNSGDIWHEGTNNRLMFRQGATSREIVVSDGTTTAGTTAAGTIRIRINGTNYDVLRA